MEPLSDISLWSNVSNKNNKQAFTQLYKRHASALFNYGKRYTQDNLQIEESIQELFTEFWNERKKIKIQNNFKSYLFISFKRKLVKKLKPSNSIVPIEFAQNESGTSIETDIIASEEEKQLKIRLKGAMSELSGRQREAIYLKFFEKLDYSQIAELMEIKIPAVYKLISNGLNILRKKI